MKNKTDKYIYNWLQVSLIVLVVMVFIGGLTRLTHSGLSIVYWKPVTGIMPPLSYNSWMDEFEKYKEYPEYKKNNFNMTLNEYKVIYYWEYIHRLLGRIIGMLFFIPFIYFYYKKYLNTILVRKLSFLFLMGSFQGFMGWYMVKSGLVDIPEVSHYRLSIHLVLAFVIIGYIYKIQLSLKFFKRKVIENYNYYNKFIVIIILLFFFQIIYGAFMAGLKAGQFWNTFPLIEGKVIPTGLFVSDPLYLNFLENNKMVQFLHRYLGLLLMLLIYFFSYKLKNVNNVLNLKIRNLVTIVSCQVFLGIITLISNVPIILASFHQLIAIYLMLQLINIKHFLKYK